VLPIAPRSLADLARAFGGDIVGADDVRIARIARTSDAQAGDLAVLLHRRYLDEAREAIARGAVVLVDPAIADLPGWRHPEAARAMADVLDTADAPATPPVVESELGAGVHVLPRVRIGKRVRIDPGAVIGAPGFGHVATRSIPQLGGVIIEDDVEIGALCTIASGTLAPTIVRRGAKLDAQVHVGHNCEIGAGTMIAAQTGIAGSVKIGRGVLIGGQVGIADHIVIGDGARIAAKSGVIGDVAPGETVAGYPAVKRMKWLRGLARLYRAEGGNE
jgi:UDP-3-O-[3-hydroxymyristoyl] glucosamine N-acyltransferase